jgi:hypothetical protein
LALLVTRTYQLQGINVAALIAGGFIVEQSTPKPKKPAKTSTEPNEEI